MSEKLFDIQSYGTDRSMTSVGRMDDRHAPHMDSSIESVIGENLRTVFSDILDEPVPKRFKDLLDGLLESSEQ